MADPSLLSIELLDSLGVTVSSTIFVTTALTNTVSDIAAYAREYALLLDKITDSQVTGLSVRLRFELPDGLKTLPAATAENERTGLFNFSQAGSTYKFGIDVPAIAQSKIVNGKINLSDTDINNWRFFITSATAALQIVSKFLLVLNTLVDVLISFRKHRRAESRRSIEDAQQNVPR